MNSRNLRELQPLAFFLALLFMFSLAFASEKIVFSEVLYDSAVKGESSGEWMELYNPQSTAVDLGGWKISDNTGSFKIPSNTIIYGYSYIIITNDKSYFSSTYGCTPDLATDIVKLANTGDHLILMDSNGSTVDLVAWENGGGISGWSSLYANEGKSIRRKNPGTDTDSPSDWISNSAPQPTCGGGSQGGGGGGGGGTQNENPFGSFDTPLDASTVSGSIPVTGWALDDTGVDYVKIFRKDGGQSIYIGDAVFVEGARPDVQAAYPGYPNNNKAGWGYMLLTNFLPNNGNGTFILEAVANDLSGNQVSLGNKTIYCDNANAVKPFGAIDTPTQGGTVAGSSYINWGWVLTPQPNYIKEDGSTINVWVDGENMGHPVYNLYRSDIANLFPAYANYDGAIGYFYLDTTQFTDGVHTIQWTARDSGGNTDGIGSRYFTVRNSRSGINVIKQDHCAPSIDLLDMIHTHPGHISITIKELEPVKIPLGKSFSGCKGFLKIGEKLESLPIGSSLDEMNAIFKWTPGPGFFGTYDLVFITLGQGAPLIKNVTITIRARHSIE